MALHEQCVGATDEWYTPPHVFEALGCRFDMDVASPGRSVTPWIPARAFIQACSLSAEWSGFVWMNAPFGGRNGLVPWLDKFFDHRNGIALVPDRTSAPWWQAFAPKADAVLFVAPKLKFIGADGKPGKSPAQGTTLLALGIEAVKALRSASCNQLGTLMAPKDVRCMNEANNAGTTCQHLFILMPIGSDGKPLGVAAALGSWPAGVFCQHCLQPAGVAQGATPNAPVEREAIARALFERRQHRHPSGNIPQWEHQPDHIKQSFREDADAILAVRLDEAAIRKDEREKQREIDAKIADDVCIDADGQMSELSYGELYGMQMRRDAAEEIAQSIRNGGKQP